MVCLGRDRLPAQLDLRHLQRCIRCVWRSQRSSGGLSRGGRCACHGEGLLRRFVLRRFELNVRTTLRYCPSGWGIGLPKPYPPTWSRAEPPGSDSSLRNSSTWSLLMGCECLTWPAARFTKICRFMLSRTALILVFTSKRASCVCSASTSCWDETDCRPESITARNVAAGRAQ